MHTILNCNIIVVAGYDSCFDGVLERGQGNDPRVSLQATCRPRVRDQLLPEDVRGRSAGDGPADAG